MTKTTVALMVAAMAPLGCGPRARPLPPPAARPAVVSAVAATPVAATEEAADPIPAVTISLPEFRDASHIAAAESGLEERRLRELTMLHRMRRLARSVVRFTHVVYEEDDFAPDDIFVREGWMVLLGEHRGRLVGLTTRCAVDVHQPGWQYLDGREPGDPELVAGLLALHAPGEGDPRRDPYVIEHETDWTHALLRRPYGKFVNTFLARAGIGPDEWGATVERGARVQVRPIGNNDLALVAFTPRRHLGLDGEPTPEGVRVTGVWPGSAAERAGCQIGDVIAAVDGATVDTPAALAAAVADAPHLQCVLRLAPGAERTVTFRPLGGFLTDGTCDTLGIDAPMESVATLLDALTTVGDLVQTELTAQCVRCRERVQRAEVRGAPTLAEALGRLVPIAGGLLTLDADRAVDLVGSATGVGAVVASVQEWKRLLTGVDDLESFLTAFPVGDPIPLDPASVVVEAADRFTAADLYGRRQSFRLAYCVATPGGERELAAMCRMAATERRLLLAVPDGTDLQGRTHVHLVVVKPEMWPLDNWRNRAALVTEGYVNLVCIRRGACHAADHGVSDGRTTRLILDAFRKLDALDR